MNIYIYIYLSLYIYIYICINPYIGPKGFPGSHEKSPAHRGTRLFHGNLGVIGTLMSPYF